MHLPGPLRAAVGLMATAAAEVRQLPDRAIELPMLAVSSALQASLRTQQRYARLAARGDDVLNRRRPTSEPPPWATFDEPVPVEDLRRAALAELKRLEPQIPLDAEPIADAAPAAAPAAPKAPAKKAPAKKSSPRKAPATKAPAKKAAKKAPVKTASPPDAAAETSEGKTVSKPRHTAPSRFDDAGD